MLNTTSMRELRGALHGKAIVDGKVDHSSVATTPWLQLHVVTYDNQIDLLGSGQPLFDEGLIDGISLWISGPKQDALHSSLTSLVSKAQERMAPAALPLYTGGYLLYSSTGWLSPGPFYDLLNQSIKMYDDGRVHGFYVFAGNALWAPFEAIG